MNPEPEWREPARVLMHLNGGFTKVILERTIGIGHANGGTEWDIPTHRIPLHLRAIGSRFVIVMPAGPQESGDAAGYAIEALP